MKDSPSNETATGLTEMFSDPEVRQAYAEGFQHTWIASQLTMIRQQRGLTQKDLAAMVGTKQPGIARMERDDYGKWNIGTLTGIAAALDCWLSVSFESYGTLLEKVAAFRSPEFLQRPSFHQDPIINPAVQEWPALAHPGPHGEMSRKLRKWFDARTPLTALSTWLTGEDLPSAGDDIPPSLWLSDALSNCPLHQADLAASRIAQFLEESTATGSLFTATGSFAVELFRLMSAWPRPEAFSEPLEFAWTRSPGTPEGDLLRHPLRRNQVEAMKHNQSNDRFENIWLNFVEDWHGNSDSDVKVLTGLKGLIMIPDAPNAFKFVEGYKRIDLRSQRRTEARSNSLRLAKLLGKTLNTIPTGHLDSFRDRVWKEARQGDLDENLLNAVSVTAPPQLGGTEGFVVQEYLVNQLGESAALTLIP